MECSTDSSVSSVLTVLTLFWSLNVCVVVLFLTSIPWTFCCSSLDCVHSHMTRPIQSKRLLGHRLWHTDTDTQTHAHTHACRWIKYDLLSSQLIHFYIIFLFFLSFSFRYIIKPFNFYVFPKPFNRTSPDIKFICQVRPCHVQAVALRLLYLTVYMKTFVFSEFQYWLSGQSGLWLQQGLLSWWVDLMTPDSHILSKCWGGGTLQQYSTLTDLHLNSILIVNSF